MARHGYLLLVTGLAAAGTLFSGYLTAVRVFSNRCAFDAACPMALGYPACFVAFALFAALLATSAVALQARTRSSWPAVTSALLAAAGSAFAGPLALAELAAWTRGELQPSALGLPTCVYGAALFAGLLLLSVEELGQRFIFAEEEGPSPRPSRAFT